MLIALLPILAQTFDVTAGAIAQGRYRSDNTGEHADSVNTGRLSLHLGMKRTDWILSLSPSLAQLNIGETESSAVFFTTANLAANMRLTRDTSLWLAETATYGQENLQALSNARFAPVQNPQNAGSGAGGTAGNNGTGTTSTPVVSPLAVVAPANTTIRFGYLATSLGLTHRLDRKWATTAYGIYSVSRRFGSNNETATTGVFPDSRTVAGGITLSRALSARDTLTLNSITSQTQIDPGGSAFISTASLGWNHRFDRVTSMTANGGVSYFSYEQATTPRHSGVLPYAMASANRTTAFAAGRGSLFATIGIFPAVDGLYGTVTETVTSSAGASWQKRRWTASAVGYGTSRIGDTTGNTSLLSTYGTTETITYDIDRTHWRATLGSYQTWQRYTLGAESSAFFWSGLISLAYTTGTLPL